MPERYLLDRNIQRLRDSAFRAFAMATMWSVSNRTDGLILPEDLALIPGFAEGTEKVLVDANLWVELDEGWLIADFESTQTSRNELDILENARRRDREKKQRQRANVPGVVPGDVSPGTAQARRGEGTKTPSVLSRTTTKSDATKRATRIPDPFIVTPAMVEWAQANAPAVDGKRATEMFRNHWTAASGRTATKLDWPATWRNWMLRDQQAAEKTPRKQSPEERMRATLALVPELQLKEIS